MIVRQNKKYSCPTLRQDMRPTVFFSCEVEICAHLEQLQRTKHETILFRRSRNNRQFLFALHISSCISYFVCEFPSLTNAIIINIPFVWERANGKTFEQSTALKRRLKKNNKIKYLSVSVGRHAI